MLYTIPIILRKIPREHRNRCSKLVRKLNPRLFKIIHSGGKQYFRFRFKVKSESDPQKFYFVDLMFLDLNKLSTREFSELLKQSSDYKWEFLAKAMEGPIAFYCSCPAFTYWGFKFLATKKKMGIWKEKTPAKIRVQHLNELSCKHVITVLISLMDNPDYLLQAFSETRGSNENSKNNRDEGSDTDKN